MAITKWIGIAGQSNALLFVAPAPPANCAVSRVARASAPIGAGPVGSPWPNGWGAADPNGWRHRLAQESLVHRATLARPAIFWLHGESDANGHSDTYHTDMIAMIADMDTRMGRSDCVWGFARLNDDFNAEEPVYGPIIRTAFETIVAAYPTRSFWFDTDALALDGSDHYLVADHPTLWSSFLSGVETITGDGSWTP